MPWGEVYRLTQTLAADPSSRIGAALWGLEFPLSREAFILMDLFDLTHQIAWRQGGGKGSRPKSYPRPWPDHSGTKRYGDTAGRARAEIVEILNAHGHSLTA